MKIKDKAFGITELLFSLLLTVGSVTIFKACGAHEGRYMACHWAQNAVTLTGAVLTAASLIKLLIPDRAVKTGIAVTISLLSAAAAFIPGTVIGLCMMQTMRCHTVFRPAAAVAASLLAVTALADVIVGIKERGAGNEHKKAYA